MIWLNSWQLCRLCTEEGYHHSSSILSRTLSGSRLDLFYSFLGTPFQLSTLNKLNLGSPNPESAKTLRLDASLCGLWYCANMRSIVCDSRWSCQRTKAATVVTVFDVLLCQ